MHIQAAHVPIIQTIYKVLAYPFSSSPFFLPSSPNSPTQQRSNKPRTTLQGHSSSPSPRHTSPPKRSSAQSSVSRCAGGRRGLRGGLRRQPGNSTRETIRKAMKDIEKWTHPVRPPPFERYHSVVALEKAGGFTEAYCSVQARGATMLDGCR
ncbi:unnamed protein product [Cyclocybe aegerita]|uniref:Uncharacterized protein n=1 Tax=Cyclocybe aegerita TaxID=1973307 RepID=A0A8S0XSS8_CYCAE|nr:unnamed protein product [Cyclocybe aegerita]